MFYDIRRRKKSFRKSKFEMKHLLDNYVNRDELGLKRSR